MLSESTIANNGGLEVRETIRAKGRLLIRNRTDRKTLKCTTTPRGLEFAHLAVAGHIRRGIAQRAYRPMRSRADRIADAIDYLNLSRDRRLDAAPVLP